MKLHAVVFVSERTIKSIIINIGDATAVDDAADAADAI